MPFSFTPAGFLESIADGAEAVTLILTRGEEQERVAIANALQQPLSRSLATRSNVQIEGDEVVWNVSEAELNPSSNGRDIRFGDIVEVSETERYRVVMARRVTLKTRWELICRTHVGAV